MWNLVAKKNYMGWSGKALSISYDRLMDLFALAGRPKEGLKSIEEEIIFKKRYYRTLLMEEGVTDNLDEKAELLFELTWLKSGV